MTDDLDHAALAAALAPLALGLSASEIHGSLIGYLGAGARVERDDWLAALELDAAESARVDDPLLKRFLDVCRAQVADFPVFITPLLPRDQTALAPRAEALVDWCRGFLGGFGLGGTAQSRALSNEAKTILTDLGAIGSRHFDIGDEADEPRLLAELIEFAGVASATLCREIAATTPRLH